MNPLERGITIYYCGHEQCSSGHFFGPAVRQHYLLHVVLKGRGRYRAGKKEYALEEGDAFLIKPQEVTYYQADEANPWEYSWTAFSGLEAERLLMEYHADEAGYYYHAGQGERWKDYMEKLVNAFREGGHNMDEMAGYFTLLFSQFERREGEREDYEQGYLARAQSYMHHNYSYPIRIEDVSAYVGIDRTYLYRLFMKYKGISPKTYLTSYRIIEAKRLLEETGLSITETGLSCGFHDSSVFSKRFLSMEGESPLQYRKKKRKIISEKQQNTIMKQQKTM